MKRILSHAVVGVVVLLCTVAVMRSQQASPQTQRFTQFENDDVKV
jgi:hypothetical protein